MTSGRRSSSYMLGNLSLGLMVLGMLVMEGLIHTQVLTSPLWRIVATGFEAGTIGGIADWYAVRAMFHHVPLPLLSRHSNILVRNRPRITDAIVDAVQNKWLSAQAIEAFLANQSPSKLMLDYLHQPSHQAQIIAGARQLLTGALSRADTHHLESLIESVLRRQLQGLALAQPLGRWVSRMIDDRRHEAMWDSLLLTLEKALASPGSEDALAASMQRTATRYARMGLMKGLGKRVMEASGMIDYHAMARATMEEAAAFVDSARHNPAHPIRQRLDDALRAWAGELASNQGQAVTTVNQWRDRLAEQAHLQPLVHSMVARLRQTLLEQLADDQTDLTNLIRHWLGDQLAQFSQDHQKQAAVDAWVRQRVPDLVARYSHVIGDVVRSKLAAADDAQWVSDIEQNVGSDLQYIRLNGAVVGFGVGVILASVRILLLWLTG